MIDRKIAAVEPKTGLRDLLQQLIGISGVDNWVDTTQFATLAAAIASIGTNQEGTLVTSKMIDLGQISLEVPSSITLQFLPGGALNVQAGETVIIHGEIQAGLHKIFDIEDNGPSPADKGHVLLQGPQINVMHFGAKGNGVDDDATATANRDAIQAAVDAAGAAGGGTVYIPVGTYVVKKATGGGGFNGCVRLNNYSNLKIVGAGWKSIIKLFSGEADGADAHVFRCDNTTNVLFSDFMIDGSKHGGWKNEQKHGIFIQDSARIYVQNVRFYQLLGDGIFILAPDSPKVMSEDIHVTNCYFHDTGRSGIAHHGGARRCFYIGNLFESNEDQDLDFEAKDLNRTDFFIIGNTFLHDNGAKVIAPTDLKRCYIIGNSFYSSVATGIIVRGDDFLISGNTFNNVDIFILGEGLTNSRIVNNFIQATSSAIEVRGSNGLTISGNEIITTSTTPASDGVAGLNSGAYTASNVVIEGNRIAGAGAFDGISLRIVSNVALKGLTIRNNTIKNFVSAVVIRRGGGFTEATLQDVIISGNRFFDDQASPTLVTGIEIHSDVGPEFVSRLIITDNLMGGSITTPIVTNDGGHPASPRFWAVGGQAYLDRADYEGQGTPELMVTAPVGSTYRRRDGGAGISWYIKESGIGSTGWTAK